MFHLKYPRFRGFFTWEELGCLARALGFPQDLFRSHANDEIEAEEHGLSTKAIQLMLDYNLLFNDMHNTQNMHSADWNGCVIRKAVHILDHRAITFEELNNTRLAYQTYEAGDMKGMLIDQNVILRAIKMCGKTISPLKLMHRLKHMRQDFDEKDRMQLYDFLDLVLWCDIYLSYNPEAFLTTSKEMERELFQLMDFDKLLSHHDERVAKRLNEEYLKEEWDFGKERFGGKRATLKEPPLICVDSRIQTARQQKQNYRYLKGEVSKSQKMVYVTKAGFFRPRPVTAPDLSRYHRPEEVVPEEVTAETAYHTVQKMLKSISDKKGGPDPAVDLSDKPLPEPYIREVRPRIVSDTDLDDIERKWDNLLFDVGTLETRCQINKEDDMEYFIPKYKLKLDQSKMAAEELVCKLTVESPEKIKPTSIFNKDEVVRHLAYPESQELGAHLRKCDARFSTREETRFRGWHAVQSKDKGHYILIAPSYDSSPKGKLFSKMNKASAEQVKKVQSNYLLYRYNKRKVPVERPVTAPAVMTSKRQQSIKGRPCSRESIKTVDTGYSSSDERSASAGNTRENHNIQQNEQKHKASDLSDNTSPCFGSMESRKGQGLGDFHPQMLQVRDSMEKSPFERHDSDMREDFLEDVNASWTETPKSSSCPNIPKIPSQFSNISLQQEKLLTDLDERKQEYVEDEKTVTQLKQTLDHNDRVSAETPVPVPYMEHSKPRVVSIGNIGKVKLLENITESRFWEDMYNKNNANDSPDTLQIPAKETELGGDRKKRSEDSEIEAFNIQDFSSVSSQQRTSRSKSRGPDTYEEALQMLHKRERRKKKKTKTSRKSFILLAKQNNLKNSNSIPASMHLHSKGNNSAPDMLIEEQTHDKFCNIGNEKGQLEIGAISSEHLGKTTLVNSPAADSDFKGNKYNRLMKRLEGEILCKELKYRLINGNA
ncbi:hypothetical protein CHS0354_005107 [Potamilus streckersoni]|uniref:Uncharacterized protein n=1 Tax=Potamilus streckersoni TaxID=2493646 RepID=A0AAE0SH65_9BIVA|nr:hypothetical protein CHS0354_005107 [Potamilus streckersoni]